MSEQEMASGQPAGASGADQVKESPVASGDVQGQEASISPDSYKKAVEQDRRSRAAKQRAESDAAEWRAKAEALEQAQLEEKGHYKEMYEKQAQKAKELEEELNNTMATTALSNGLNAAKLAAREAGCTNLELFKRVVDVSSIEYDDSLLPVEEQVKALVEESRKQFPEMFQKSAPKVANHNIGQADTAPKSAVDEMAKMTRAELAKFAMAKGIK